MEQKVKDAEQGFRNYMPAETGYQRTVLEAMNYSLTAGGKRLRPIFMNEMYRLFGGEDEAVIRPFMMAMEMVHTYSLVHDDLPAMDNDDYRRGRLTNHKVYGEAMAILAGDGLLHHATEIMAAACAEKPSARTANAMRAIAHGAGIFGMLAGQAADVALEGQPFNAETLDFIHLNKTAAMIRGALEAGAILGGAEEETVRGYGLAGQNIGLAFQIIDDILDVTSTTEELGKPVHSDEKNKKTTYVTLFGIDEARQIANRLSMQAENFWSGQGESCAFLLALTKHLANRKH